jgi:hypothetical protein
MKIKITLPDKSTFELIDQSNKERYVTLSQHIFGRNETLYVSVGFLILKIDSYINNNGVGVISLTKENQVVYDHLKSLDKTTHVELKQCLSG